MADTKRVVEIQVDIKWDAATLNAWPKQIKEGIFDMAFETANLARAKAPYVTGALKNSIHVDASRDPEIWVIAGGTSAMMDKPPTNSKSIVRFVDYADLREKGPNRNPATEHYMENAKNDIFRGDWQKRFFGNMKGITR